MLISFSKTIGNRDGNGSGNGNGDARNYGMRSKIVQRYA